jgi:hypothetical protein
MGADFTWLWQGANDLLQGRNPYDSVPLAPDNPFQDPLLYPLPAVLLALPLAPLPPEWAAGAAMACTTGALTFVLTAPAHRHLLPLVGSIPFLYCLWWAQVTPLLLLLAYLLPALPLATVKPSLGAAVVSARPTWRGLVVSGLVLLASLLVLPSWPLDWLRAVSDVHHGSPLLVVPGPLLLLAWWRWRQPEARLLGVLALVPQRFLFYDQVLLFGVCRSWRESAALAGSSWAVVLFILFVGPLPVWGFNEYTDPASTLVLLGVFLPALVIVLRRSVKHSAESDNPLH